jgi:hypothetical protein
MLHCVGRDVFSEGPKCMMQKERPVALFCCCDPCMRAIPRPSRPCHVEQAPDTFLRFCPNTLSKPSQYLALSPNPNISAPFLIAELLHPTCVALCTGCATHIVSSSTKHMPGWQPNQQALLGARCTVLCARQPAHKQMISQTHH